jgi:hypothetical protein
MIKMIFFQGIYRGWMIPKGVNVMDFYEFYVQLMSIKLCFLYKICTVLYHWCIHYMFHLFRLIYACMHDVVCIHNYLITYYHVLK